MLSPLLAYANKSFVQSTFISFTLSVILVITLTLLAACNGGGEEEPNPTDTDPLINSFSPTTGFAGTTEVVIVGKNFSANIADLIVKIGNVEATVTGATTTSITITVPDGAVTGKISVTVKGKTATSANDFIVTTNATPLITSFSPTMGVTGATVVISGENFSANITDLMVKIGNVVATVTEATTTSITITVPDGAVTGKISVTVNGTTATSANDFVVTTASPSDFFTLTVDASYETSQTDAWILASSKSGDWIYVEPYEGGQTKILNGIVPDANSFTLHFLTVSQQSGNYFFSMKSIADVPVNGDWLLKTVSSTTDTKILSLTINNYIIPPDRSGFNEIVTVSSNEGTGSYSSATSGNTVNMEVNVLKSPADILVTLYENGYPKYVSYENVTIPSTITLDASTEGVVADRKFTMTLPTNNYFYVAIDAFEQNQKFGYSMSKFLNINGGASVNLGYKQGYDKYRTLISYKNDKKMVDLVVSGSAVEETHTFPSFDFTFTSSNLNDFQAVSDLPFDVVSADFQYNQPGVVLLWNVVKPASGTSRAINFKVNAFPQEILDNYPALPPVNQISLGTIYGYQYNVGSKNYSDMIDAASKSGSVLVDLSSDNFFRFARTK